MAPASPQRNRILVVDDNLDTIDFVVPYLQATGFEVMTARDGEEALQQASKHQPHVIMLDVMMPEQDGWLVCSKLKSLPTSPRIVLMTGVTRSDLEQFAQFVHADAVLRKPFGVEQIDDCLHAVIA